MSKAQQHAIYKAEQQQRYNERKIREWKRAKSLSMSQPEYDKAHRKVLEYQKRNRELVKHTDGLYRNHWREKPGFEVPRDVRWQNLKHEKHMFDN